MRISSRIHRVALKSINFLPKGKRTALKVWHSFYTSNPNWDPWILKDGDVYRLFYLVGSKHAVPFWRYRSTIHGAVSTDMKQWKFYGPVLDPEPANAWEAGRLLAGFTYKEDGIYYLFYSASKTEPDILHEAIGLATSLDGLNWQRHSTHELLKPDDRWYGTDGVHVQWRDPYIFKDHETGRYYMFICACLKEVKNSIFRGCVGLAVADNITGPYELLPPAATPLLDGTGESIFIEMERPQVIYKYGKYHLFFSSWAECLNPQWVEKVGREQLTDSSLYWYTSDKPTGPFTPASDKPVISGSEKTGMYGTNFLPSPDDPEEFIAYGWQSKGYALEVSSFFKVYWNSNSILIN